MTILLWTWIGVPFLHRCQCPQAAEAVGGAQPPQDDDAGRVHDGAFQKALAGERADDDDVRPVGPAKAGGDGGGDGGRGQVLGLDVERLSRRLDRPEHEGLDLAHGQGLRDGAGKAERHVAPRGSHPGRPEPAGGRRRRGHDRRRPRPRFPPAPERVRLQEAGGGTLDHQHRVVEGDAAVVRVALAVVAPVGEVDAAAKGQLAVDDDELFVPAGNDRALAVEAQMDPPGRPLVEAAAGPDAALQAVQKEPVPDEDPHLQPRGRRDEAAQATIQRLAAHLDPAVDVPAEHEDAVPGPVECCHQRREVALAVDEQRRPARPRHALAGASRYEDGRQATGSLDAKRVFDAALTMPPSDYCNSASAGSALSARRSASTLSSPSICTRNRSTSKGSWM